MFGIATLLIFGGISSLLPDQSPFLMIGAGIFILLFGGRMIGFIADYRIMVLLMIVVIIAIAGGYISWT
jgi:hypothetical protein